MGFIQRLPVTITTASDGTGTGYVTPDAGGHVLAIRYVKGDYANGVDFVVTDDTTGQAILTATDVNASASFYPRAQVHDVADGSVMTLDGTRKSAAPVPVGAGTRIKIAVAQGGDTKSGTFHVLIG